VLIVSISIGTGTSSGYAALVSGWGNVILIDKPPKVVILGPSFKAIGEGSLEYRLRSPTHLCDSGLMRSELLRLAYMGLPATNDRHQPLLCANGRGWYRWCIFYHT
jgi:hypothetical protein